MELSQEEYRALARLEASGSPDWQTLKALLARCRESERDDLEAVTALEVVYRLQGRATAWGDLLGAIGRSREMIHNK